MRGIIKYAVHHSLVVNLLMVFAVVAGLLALSRMTKEAFPNITYDVVTVRTDYKGASAKEIEKLINIKLEDELKEVNGIKDTTSISSEDISLIVLRLDPTEKDMDKVVDDIQRAVDQTDDLPQDLEDQPTVDEIETRNLPVIQISLSGSLDEIELQRHARLLESKLLDITGVAQVSRIGWRDREIWVEVSPKAVDEYQLPLEDILQALSKQNQNIPGGTLDITGEEEFLVRTNGEFETSEEVRKIIIRANDLGNWIRVEDVATVQDAFEDDKVLEKTRGQRAITLTVIKKESADIIKVVDEAKKVAKGYEENIANGLEVSFFDDFSFYVKRRLNVLMTNGKIGIFLVLISLLIFLSRSVALFTAFGIPVALAITFLLMGLMGLSINLISMFALIMVLGIIVDDSIVIAENIYRHVKMGESPKEAAINGAKEVALPVISTVLTTIAAFVPIFFMKGIMGKYVGIIPFVVIAALIASLIESLVVLPSHLADASKWLHKEKKKAKSRFEKGFQRFRIAYLRILRWVVSHRYKAVAIILLLFVFAFGLFHLRMKFVLFPEGLIEEFFIRTKAPMGTSLEENAARMSKLEDLIQALPDTELDNYITQIGLTREDQVDPFTNRGSHVGQIHVFLTPEPSRDRKADEIIAEIRKKSKSFEYLFDVLTFDKVRAGPPVGKPVNVRIRADDFGTLRKIADRFKAKLETIEGVKDIQDDLEEGKRELRVVVKLEEAQKAFVTVRDIANSVRHAIEGTIATTIQKTDEEIDVIVRFPDKFRKSHDVFDKIFVPNQFDKLIPLNKVAEIQEDKGLHVIKRLDRRRMIGVTATVDEQLITPVMVQKQVDEFYRNEILAEYPDLIVSYGGEQEETKESMQDFYRAFILAIFLIFIILASMFNSLIQPLVVMVAIPFGLVGVIFAFYLHGQPFSFMSLLGLIGLSGVVVNDSIVLVDFINRHRKKGWSASYSILEAGRLRLRPVLLTSISTVAGLMPVAYGIGGSDPFIKPMALAIGWGLFFATGLTLLVVPCIYAVFDDWKQRCLKAGKKVVDIGTHLSHSDNKSPEPTS